MPDPFTCSPLLMAPFFAARPWGGARLAGVLGKDVPQAGGPWGESWELSDHPAGRSRIANGPCAGLEFGELARRFPRELCAVERAPERFPLLIKFIDAAADLSVQVHPADAQAPPGERGKHECWYIMDCAPGAAIVHGLAAGVTPERLRRAAETGRIEPCLRRVPIRPGDFIQVPAGTVHAILGGTLLCETQQASDTTYRLWDWGRWPARPLHIEDACRVAVCDPARLPDILNVTRGERPPEMETPLTANDFFTITMLRVEPGQRCAMILDNPHGVALCVVEGAGTMEAQAWPETVPLRAGQTWFLPVGMAGLRLRAGAAGLRLLASASRELL